MTLLHQVGGPVGPSQALPCGSLLPGGHHGGIVQDFTGTPSTSTHAMSTVAGIHSPSDFQRYEMDQRHRLTSAWAVFTCTWFWFPSQARGRRRTEHAPGGGAQQGHSPAGAAFPRYAADRSGVQRAARRPRTEHLFGSRLRPTESRSYLPDGVGTTGQAASSGRRATAAPAAVICRPARAAAYALGVQRNPHLNWDLVIGRRGFGCGDRSRSIAISRGPTRQTPIRTVHTVVLGRPPGRANYAAVADLVGDHRSASRKIGHTAASIGVQVRGGSYQ